MHLGTPIDIFFGCHLAIHTPETNKSYENPRLRRPVKKLIWGDTIRYLVSTVEYIYAHRQNGTIGLSSPVGLGGHSPSDV